MVEVLQGFTRVIPRAAVDVRDTLIFNQVWVLGHAVAHEACRRPRKGVGRAFTR